MSDHTPGPWTLETPTLWITAKCPFNGDEMFVAPPRGWGHLTGKGHTALGLEHDEAFEIQKANGRLIAAAPDLLDALEAANALLDVMAPPELLSQMLKPIRARKAQIEQALSQARGDTETERE